MARALPLKGRSLFASLLSRISPFMLTDAETVLLLDVAYILFQRMAKCSVNLG